MNYFADTNIFVGFSVIHDEWHEQCKKFITADENQIFWSNLVKKEYEDKLQDIINSVEFFIKNLLERIILSLMIRRTPERKTRFIGRVLSRSGKGISGGTLDHLQCFMADDLTEIGPEFSFRFVIMQNFLSIEQREHDLLHQVLTVLLRHAESTADSED
jgi:hypothetical protein